MALSDQHQEPPRLSDQRGFARGTGFIFQFVGFIFLFGGCCLGSLSGLIQGPIDATPRDVVEWVTASPPGQVISAVNTVVTALAGLALMVFGIGLSNERRTSATGAVIVTVVLAVSWCTTTLAAILTALSIARILANLFFAAIAVWLVLMALAARREMRLHPPPPDEPVTPEFLAEFDAKRKMERELRELEKRKRTWR